MLKKTFYSKREVESAFIDFLALKFLQFYCTGINDVVKSIAEMHRCSVILFWLIKTIFKFIKVFLKVGSIFRATKYYQERQLSKMSL